MKFDFVYNEAGLSEHQIKELEKDHEYKRSKLKNLRDPAYIKNKKKGSKWTKRQEQLFFTTPIFYITIMF